MADEIMTVEELAKYLKTGVATIYKLAQEGKIPGTKVGNQWRFRKEKVDEWLDQGGMIENKK
jgi:excisionase family DNA binding protein